MEHDRSGNRWSQAVGEGRTMVRSNRMTESVKVATMNRASNQSERPSPQDIRDALRDIGLALSAGHGTVATDLAQAKPDETSWRIDHTREIKALGVLKRALPEVWGP